MEPALDVPQCISSHLKEFTLGGYEGYEIESEIAIYIMENARVLRTISIHCEDMDFDEKYINLKKFASCRRASVHCRLSFD